MSAHLDKYKTMTVNELEDQIAAELYFATSVFQTLPGADGFLRAVKSAAYNDHIERVVSPLVTLLMSKLDEGGTDAKVS